VKQPTPEDEIAERVWRALFKPTRDGGGSLAIPRAVREIGYHDKPAILKAIRAAIKADRSARAGKKGRVK
jgi:hypothetical protein